MSSNHRPGIAVRETRPMDGGAAMYRHAGYEDARKGLPFRREYDGWPQHQQRNYERGRQFFADVHHVIGGTEKDMLHTKALPWRRNMYSRTHLERAYGGNSGLKCCPFLREVAAFRDMTTAAYGAWFSPVLEAR